MAARYRELAAATPNARTLDARGTVDDVTALIARAVDALLPAP